MTGLKLRYRKFDANENREVKYSGTFDGYDENEVALSLENDFIAGARRKIPFNQVKKRIGLLVNFNYE